MKVRDIVREDAKITKSDGSGVEITADDGVKTTLPADKAAALMPDPEKPGEYDLNPQAVASSSGAQPTGPAVGANVEIKTAEAVSDDLSTMPTADYVKGIYAAAAENGMDAPEAEAVKKQMVLAPNGEVDIMATMQKAAQVFQSPEFKQMLADLDALVKKAEAQQSANPELARIQELSGVSPRPVSPQSPESASAPSKGPASISQAPDGTYTVTYNRPPLAASGTPAENDIPAPQTGIKDLATAQRILASIQRDDDVAYSLSSSIQVHDTPTQEDTTAFGVTQHDNGDTSYNQGPLSMRQNKDGSSDMTATLGDTTARMQQNPIGVKTLTAQGVNADAISSVDASASRKGVDPTKFAQFKKQAGVSESAELTAMLKIAGLR